MIRGTGTVTGSLVAAGGSGSVSGWLAGTPRPYVTGTVDRDRIESYDGDASAVTLYSYRILLDGEDVTADLAGEVVVERNLDEPARAEFTLVGTPYSPLVSRKTWTRTPVAIYFRQGAPGRVREVLEFVGFTDTVAQAGDDSYRVQCLDVGAKFYAAPVCYEVAPGAGLTRDAILRQLALLAGYSSADIEIPNLGKYSKPFHTGNRTLLDLLSSFGEPDALHWRTDVGGKLHAFRVQMRREPEPPHHVWHVDDLIEHPTITPPEDVAARWIVRGTATLPGGTAGGGGTGIETEITVTEVYGLYDPVSADQRQNTDGTVSPIGQFDNTAFRLISRLVDTVQRAGDRVLSQVTEEWGWSNPAAGQYTTGTAPGNGPGPQGVYFQEVYIAGGRFVRYIAERFLKILRREQVPRYDDEGTQVGERVSQWEWYRVPHAVRDQGVASINFAGVIIGDDGKSYKRLAGNNQIEIFGLSSEHLIEYNYDDETGARTREVTDTFAWFSPATHAEDVGPYYIMFDGSGQKDREASFQLIERQVKTSVIDESQRLLGEIFLDYGWTSNESAAGTYDWGGFRSELEEQEFRLKNSKSVSYSTRTAGSYETVSYEGDSRRTATFQGLPPVPAHKASSWTTFRSEPIEVVLDDETLELWFGFDRSIIQNEYVQTTTEARDLLARQRSRELSFQVLVRRHETLAEIGETVLMIDPLQGLLHRGVIVSIRKTRSTSLANAEYTVEIPLLRTRYL